MGHITPAQQEIIVGRIKAGSFPHVAAESAGVARRVFDQWMRAGRRQRRGRRHAFWLTVSQTLAEVRVLMEHQAKDKDPKFWLRFGPGKEGGPLRGWGPAAKPPRRPRRPGTDWQPELFALLGEIAE